MNILEYAEMQKLSLSCMYIPSRPDRKWVCEFRGVEHLPNPGGTVRLRGGGTARLRGAGDSPIEAINDFSNRISEKTIVMTSDVPQLEPVK